MFALVFSTVLLIGMWLIGDVEIGTKFFLTGLYVVSWIPLLWFPQYVIAVHAILAIVLGGATFGVDWLNQRV